MSGLNEKGKKDYPKFTKKQLEVHECEVCKDIRNVKKYKIIRKSGKESEIYLCNEHAKYKPKGVKIILIRENIETKKKDKTEENYKESVGDSLLL